MNPSRREEEEENGEENGEENRDGEEEEERTGGLTDALGQNLQQVLGDQQVGELHQAAQLLGQVLQLILRHVEAHEALHAAHLLEVREGQGGEGLVVIPGTTTRPQSVLTKIQ